MSTTFNCKVDCLGRKINWITMRTFLFSSFVKKGKRTKEAPKRIFDCNEASMYLSKFTIRPLTLVHINCSHKRVESWNAMQNSLFVQVLSMLCAIVGSNFVIFHRPVKSWSETVAQALLSSLFSSTTALKSKNKAYQCKCKAG